MTKPKKDPVFIARFLANLSKYFDRCSEYDLHVEFGHIMVEDEYSYVAEPNGDVTVTMYFKDALAKGGDTNGTSTPRA